MANALDIRSQVISHVARILSHYRKTTQPVNNNNNDILHSGQLNPVDNCLENANK